MLFWRTVQVRFPSESRVDRTLMRGLVRLMLPAIRRVWLRRVGAGVLRRSGGSWVVSYQFGDFRRCEFLVGLIPC